MGMHLGSRTTQVLLGPDHTTLGEFALRSVTADLVIALSRGRHAKGYPSVDPNEDAVVGSAEGDIKLMAVVDGHNGFDAARVATHLVVSSLPDLMSSSFRFGPLAGEVSHRLRFHLKNASPKRAETGCALLLAHLHGQRLRVAGWGDADLMIVRGRRVWRLGGRTEFISAQSTPRPAITSVRLRPGDHVIAGTDGLFDFLGSSWKQIVRALAQGDAASTAAGLIDSLFDNALSDNVALTVATVAKSARP